MFRSQGHQGQLPDGMPSEMITFRFFAKHYSWTPEQVRSLSVEELEWMPLIEVAVSEAERQEQAAQERVRRRSGS